MVEQQPTFDAVERKEAEGGIRKLELSGGLDAKLNEIVERGGVAGAKAKEAHEALTNNLNVLTKMTKQTKLPDFIADLMPNTLNSEEADAVLHSVERELEESAKYLGTWLEGINANDENFVSAVMEQINEPLVSLLQQVVKKQAKIAEDYDVDNLYELYCAMEHKDAKTAVLMASTPEAKEEAEARLKSAQLSIENADRLTRQDKAYKLAQAPYNI